MEIQPYLFFDGRCEEAVEFYRRALGAHVDMLMRYRENPEPPPPGMIPPGMDDRIMHASLRIGDAVIMASDDCSPHPRAFGGFSLSISVPDASTADRMFAALADGGEVQMPLDRTFWSPRFGMLTDRFGVAWMINVSP
ncbi:VOC family protein [Thioalkalivibrio thiocyanodenitrificans]|uniref:VOC family protein n=1 Tax=Thioalkalivibrio thiocyanodenitrificans TaxID=243063 RepID=UPI000370454D|nr:VOC family protein [Thioalkalivibrio thiocyanodenitrificans]